MKQTKIILGIFFLSSLFYAVSQASANLANIVEVVQQVKQASGTLVPTPLTPPVPPLAPTQPNGYFNPIGQVFPQASMSWINPLTNIKAGNPVRIPTTFSCQGGLQSLNIGLTDTKAQVYYVFDFDYAAIFSNSKMQALCQQGMFISLGIIQVAGGLSAAQVSLTDKQGNVYAQSTSRAFPPACGFVYANYGFNMNNSLILPTATQTYANWVPIANGNVLWYQDNGAATEVSTPKPGIGGQSTTPPQSIT